MVSKVYNESKIVRYLLYNVTLFSIVSVCIYCNLFDHKVRYLLIGICDMLGTVPTILLLFVSKNLVRYKNKFGSQKLDSFQVNEINNVMTLQEQLTKLQEQNESLKALLKECQRAN
eukprot:TRINITY_DN5784_c0_g1_i1.p1 TRINITY_DN5784_c0_g1~~TRINITY_DN5784_c0_g1_i1.p1  ORF type:complete len:132 (-),score=14.37 TRINITY_DN5784_c0_g1_i1:75-422(-)